MRTFLTALKIYFQYITLDISTEIRIAILLHFCTIHGNLSKELNLVLMIFNQLFKQRKGDAVLILSLI